MNKTVFLLLALVFFGTGCRETILHNLNELQANRVLVTLNEASIKAEKQIEGAKWNVVVPDHQSVQALKLIENSRLLYRDLTGNIQEPKGLLASKEERINYIERQESLNLERTIEAIPGILEARVHFNIGEVGENSLVPRTKHLSASVLVVANGKQTVADNQIRTIVAGASGVKAEAISVIFSFLPAESKNLITGSDAVKQGNLSSSQSSNKWEALRKVTDLAGLEYLSPIILIVIFAGVMRLFFRRRASALSRKSVEVQDEDSEKEQRTNPQTLDPLATIQAYNLSVNDLI